MLLIHRAERADVLAQALAALLAEAPPDPFAAEVVAVPTRGIERWLTQRLSAQLGSRPGTGDGVCANIEFPFPGTLVAESLALASGIAPERDPWQTERLVWPLIDVVEAALEEAWLQPLARHLVDGREQRYARLAHVARLFDEYAVRRPELIEAWARGENLRPPTTPGAADIPERATAGWQPELWRRLREALGVPSLAERLTPACAALAADPALVELPPRLTLFGLTRLPASHLRVLEALAAGRDVHLMLLHPSPAMWCKGSAANRLLASWGRDVHGLQTLLQGRGEDRHHPLPDAARATTLLETLQADIRADRPPPGPPLGPGGADARIQLAGDDDSIRIHACHGRARQVEVLREAILHRLAADPTLEPRDVIVMCPDIDSFAPLIEATFAGRVRDESGGESGGESGTPAAGEPPTLRVRLADRSLRRTTPILAVVARLLELASSRVTASEVLDLADAGPVRARFAFDDEELTRIREWVAAAHIHWGLDAAARAPFKLAELDAGTWAAGLKRLLLGVAIDDAGAGFGGVLAAAAIQSSEIELVGRFGEFVDRLDAALRALAGPQSLASWAAALTAAADALTATPAHDAWQRRQLDAILAELVDAQGLDQPAPEGAGQRAGATGISLHRGELRELLGRRLEGRPTRANFRSGHLTFCTLVPMRSVPHRLVCLLGLDDGGFPRQSPRDGDNLLLADPRPGDRDPRTEDRQLLLDALMAAREALIITYSGNDERTNAPLPPAVPVGELLDAIDASARVGDAGDAQRARELVVVHHPLQAFDPRNFLAAGSDPARAAAGPWSFDRAALAGAHAFVAPRAQPPPFLPEPLPPATDERLLTLEELVSFVQRPVRAFLRQRLGLPTQRDEDEIDDALPIELDGLERWGIGQRLLDALRAGSDPRDAYLAEIGRGTLPPGALGAPVIGSILPIAKLLADTAGAYAGGHEPRSEQTNITLGDGTRLTGTVGGIHGHLMLQVTYSRLGPRQRLAAWVRLLALSAAHPEIPFEGLTIGRGGRQDAVQLRKLPQLGAVPAVRRTTALTELAKLVELRAAGLRAPLPLPCLTANAYAEAAGSGDDPVAAAMKKWRSGWYDNRPIEGEEDEPEHRLALGNELDLERLAVLATALWQPLLAREQVGG